MAQFTALSTDSFARSIAVRLDHRGYDATVIGFIEAKDEENRFWIYSRGEYNPRYMKGEHKELDPNLDPDKVVEMLISELNDVCEEATPPDTAFIL